MKVRYIGESFVTEDIKLDTIFNNGIYEAFNLNEDRELIYIVGVSTGFKVDLFRNLDGSPITYIDGCINLEHICMWRYEQLMENEQFLCVSPTLKTLTFGKIYTLKHDTDSWYLLFKETNTNRTYSRHNFMRLSASYIRSIKIDNILSELDNKIEERYIHDNIPVINMEEKFHLFLQDISLAEQYIKYTGVQGISMIDIVSYKKNKLYDMDDVAKFSKLSFSDILNRKNIN